MVESVKVHRIVWVLVCLLAVAPLAFADLGLFAVTEVRADPVEECSISNPVTDGCCVCDHGHFDPHEPDPPVVRCWQAGFFGQMSCSWTWSSCPTYMDCWAW